jgi:autophagy-related protein 27
VVPIAGELKGQGGGDMNPKFERLKTSASHSDSEKEGVRVEMNGGYRTLESGTHRNQKAIVEFICDRNTEGVENLYDPKDEYAEEKVKRAEGDKEDEDDPKSSSLKFVRWDEEEGDTDILRLEWRTKYACEDSKGEQDAEKGSHWGFFTWFILMFVLPIDPPKILPDTDPTK